MKEMFVKAIDTIDSKLARKFTCKDGLDWLAADMSRICMSYIFNCNVLELSQLVAEVTRDRSAFIQRLVTLVKKNYPLSKPMIVSTNQSHSGTKSGGVLGQVDSNFKYADSDEVRKLKEANKKQQEINKKQQEDIQRVKGVVDAFIDTTGIGANGQVQAAMRTADGKVKVIVDNPIADEKLAAIAQVTEEAETKLNDLADEVRRIKEENERLRQQVAKNNKGCCILN